jgi:hypothetical protein
MDFLPLFCGLSARLHAGFLLVVVVSLCKHGSLPVDTWHCKPVLNNTYVQRLSCELQAVYVNENMQTCSVLKQLQYTENSTCVCRV